ncbi:MAG TPA: acetolactate synthase small subunit [Vicinamibacteria bacterium]|nr:acetolactate synthase small subunit [Vicinamibacteria bacterium]
MDTRSRPRTFVVLVENVPGVLDRVASLFRRRSYNIESLTVGHTDRPDVSHITIVMNADDRVASLVEANLYKLVNVLEVKDVSDVACVARDLALIKVRADHSNRSEIMQVAEVFRARVVDVSPEALIFEITGSEDKVESLVDVLRPYGILEMARTGIVAMARSVATVTV